MKRLIKYRDGSEKITNSKEETIDEVTNGVKEIDCMKKIEDDPKDDPKDNSDEHVDLPF